MNHFETIATCFNKQYSFHQRHKTMYTNNEITAMLLAARCQEAENGMIVTSIQIGDCKNREADSAIPKSAA